MTSAHGDCIDRFEQHARAAPDRRAVLFEDQTLTYGELNARANALAHGLVARGLRPGDAVGVCLARSPELPISLLAVLKAGGVYVPLDPALPSERLRLIMRDTRPALLVTETALNGLCGESHGARNVCIRVDSDGAAIAAEPSHDPRIAHDPEQVAYVMYTSGSTGPPKGVEVDHLALSARFAISPYRTLGPGDVLAAVTAVSWNPSVYELLYPLASGATMALAGHDVVRDPARLSRFLADSGVTFMRAVPSLWQSLIDAGWTGHPALTIVCHGERLAQSLAQRLRACGREVWDTWGATEASAMARVEIDPSGRRVLAPGGSDPSRDACVRIQVLRRDGTPAAVGESGEIHIAGAVVARGYLGDPALTARHFSGDPAGGGRLYRTGDLGRNLPDGTIELLGREDTQVKIRGQRVELGEVEAALARHPDIAQVAVVAREEARGGQRLIAYYVLAPGSAALPSSALRRSLATTLPDYAIPAAFVLCDALALTPNGKLDRTALPAPANARPDLGSFAAPATPLEADLAQLFAEVLGYAEVGIDDGFLELGGHSLLAAQIASRIKSVFQIELSLVAFFEAATVRSLAARIARNRSLGERSSLPPIVRVELREAAQMSFAQERLWFINRLTPGEFAYNLPAATRLSGALDTTALQAALGHLLERHEVLRTSFSTDHDGRPRQSVRSVRFDLPLPLIDLSQLAPETRADAARRLIASAALVPFDLKEAPQLRAALYRLAPDEHVLFVNLHHIASDGWSKAVFRRELGAAYNALSRGQTPSLPALPFQYLDYAQWQRAYLAGGELERQLAYWKSQLAGLETLALPTDRPRPRVFSHRGARLERHLPEALLGSLKALGNARGASLYMVLLAAFQALLFRYTGQTDIAIGSPIAGRNVPETEGLIGFFVNTLVLRTQLAADLPFVRLLERVKGVALDAYAHQDLPFERLVSELNPERDMARHPLVQTVFALQNTPWQETTLAGLVSQPFELPHEMTRLDLELHVFERDSGLVCHVIYSTDLFDAWRMEQLLRHFETLLGAVVRDPSAKIADLELLSPAERERLLVTWNDTQAPYPAYQCLHELFEAQARQTPDRIAVAHEGGHVTYRELDRRANQLAHRLRRCGVDRGSRVGVGLGSSPALFVAVLGVLKAGGAYVPLDPDYPALRLAYLLDDSGVRVLITRRELEPRFESASIETVFIDDPSLADELGSSPSVSSEPGQLAYVIYTSGSTGRPNGVEIEHRGVVNVVTWHVAAHEVTARDRASLVASPSFDASVLEAWPYLISGASLHIPPPRFRLASAHLMAWLADNAITICFLPPPLLALCLDAGFAKSSLRAVVTGGDRLLRRPGRDQAIVLFNHYGPTENTVASTFARVLPSDDPNAAPPTIGRPIANALAYVLDAALNPVPVGVAGDLYVGGIGVARGYLGRPELTAARFIANPFGAGRIYKTGDVARYQPDGQLEFLGRSDDQVKLRGFRIEPAEIDVAIAEHPGVREVLTIAREDTPGERRLVSYVVAGRDPRDDALAKEHVARWQALYEEEDRSANRNIDPALDTSGWNSSFTGAPIPAVEMREWVDTSVAEISRHGPEHILEIGCGTGLLLFPLARTARRYVAMDFSRKAIADLRRRVASAPELSSKVELAVGPAHELDWLGDASFDTVILSSVVQYFPSADYLIDVLELALSHVSPGGRIFVGDVRNLDLLGAFQLALARAGRPVPREDKEMLLAPAFFAGLKDRFPRISAVEIRRKRGLAQNEMTMFRFDVTLHVETGDRFAAFANELEGSRSAAFANELEGSRSGPLSSDPLRPARAAMLLPEIRAQLKKKLPEHMMPAAFVFLDALPVTPNGKTDRRALPPPGAVRSELVGSRFAAFANELVGSRFAAFANELVGSHVAARTPTEQALARIFAEALGLDEVGIRDNFFELGGHSLMAVQVVSSIQDRLAVELPLATLFEGPTVAELARRIDAQAPKQAGAGPVDAGAEEVSTLPLSPMDANFHYGKLFFRTPESAWYQVLEIALPTLDLARLEAAILYAVNRHPIARGRLSANDALGRDAYWDVAARLACAPLIVHQVDDARPDATREAIVEKVIASPFSLHVAPTFRFALVRSEGRDVLLVRFNHCAVDGAGLYCLITSLMSHYLGQPDPAQRVVPFRTSELLAHYDHPQSTAANPFARAAARVIENNELAHLANLLPRALTSGKRARWVETSLRRPSQILPGRIHGMGGMGGMGAGAGELRDTRSDAIEVYFSAPESRRLEDTAKRLRSTLDRLFIVGLLSGGSAWNRSFGDTRRVEAYWAVNLRPPRHFGSIVANQFAWSRVRAPDPREREAWLQEMLDPAADFLLRGALDFLQAVDGFHQMQVPNRLRWLAMKAIQRFAPALVVTNTLTFGALDQGELPRALGVTHMRVHSRAGFTDRPVIVIGQDQGRFRLRMIYPRSLFDARGAERFLDTCRAATLALAEPATRRGVS